MLINRIDLLLLSILNEIGSYVLLIGTFVALNLLPALGLIWIIRSVVNYFRTPKTDSDRRRICRNRILISVAVTVIYLIVLSVLIYVLLTAAVSHM
ncbi:MAG: hypothetical protein ACI3XR_00580 [Eubacteriales bacterium]